MVQLLLQGSPNMANPNKETYRHAVAVTAYRPGLKGVPYLYTLNLSCPDDAWDKYGTLYQQAAATFRLNEPSKVNPISLFNYANSLDLQVAVSFVSVRLI